MADASALLGTWKMISWQRESVATGERADALGPDPLGFINYGADGRMFAIVIQKDRDPPAGPVPTDDEKLRLFNSMLAYAGTYTLYDDRVVHHIDTSWNQTWTGTDQVRFYKIDGNVLTITGAPAKDPPRVRRSYIESSSISSELLSRWPQPPISDLRAP
jgi:hypothetical protein